VVVAGALPSKARGCGAAPPAQVALCAAPGRALTPHAPRPRARAAQYTSVTPCGDRVLVKARGGRRTARRRAAGC
jgi:hypothetical protein